MHASWIQFLIPDKRSHTESLNLIGSLDGIDGELEKRGVAMVKTCDKDVAKEFGIDKIPNMVYFENGIPSLLPG